MTRDYKKITLQAVVFAIAVFQTVKLSTSFPVENEAEIMNKNHKDDNRQHPQCVSASPRLPPSSCRQLAFIGHYLDGIYLIANPDTNKIEAVFCDFGTNLSELSYGNVALKTKSVHFYVQRSKSFDSNNVFIPFDIERLNEGGGMNLATGIFTAPLNGIYHFEFSGLKETNAAHLVVDLQVNGDSIGTSYATALPNYFGVNGISASLRLKSGDQVGLYKTGGTLNDNGRFTHFTGWLVEEDLVLG